jgi:purine-cytosine permease-like protein
LLLASLLGLVTITTLQFYSASLTLLSVADSVRPLQPTVRQRLLTLVVLLAASCVIALASSPHFAAQFGEFLAVPLYLFTPWTAINLIDFYYVRRGHYSVREIFNPNGMYGRWNWRGLVAYFGSFAASQSRTRVLIRTPERAVAANRPVFNSIGSGGVIWDLFSTASGASSPVQGSLNCLALAFIRTILRRCSFRFSTPAPSPDSE